MIGLLLERGAERPRQAGSPERGSVARPDVSGDERSRPSQLVRDPSGSAGSPGASMGRRTLGATSDGHSAERRLRSRTKEGP
jgi:hypothetical protein